MLKAIKKTLIICLAAALLSCTTACTGEGPLYALFGLTARTQQPELDGPYSVVKVTDGDTIVVLKDGENISVRLIGIDTPESVHPDESKNTEEGKIASEYVKELLESKTVYLEYDEEQYDKYERLLAYVYLDDRETMLQKLLLEKGYAKVMTIEPNVKYKDDFAELEEAAESEGAGFWD